MYSREWVSSLHCYLKYRKAQCELWVRAWLLAPLRAALSVIADQKDRVGTDTEY